MVVRHARARRDSPARIVPAIYSPRVVTLSPAEHALLQVVRDSDEDHGGLHGEELAVDEYEAMERLCELGLVEVQGEFEEAPDGEEDERDMGRSKVVYRITAAGVLTLAGHA
jgi:hypothetical protein